jgi:hypothetical protein
MIGVPGVGELLSGRVCASAVCVFKKGVIAIIAARNACTDLMRSIMGGYLALNCEQEWLLVIDEASRKLSNQWKRGVLSAMPLP